MRADSTTTRQRLLATGMTVRQIAAAVHRGDLVRLRQGHYCDPRVDPAVQAAVRVGGRVACASELRIRGVWMLADRDIIHVHVARNAARLRDPHRAGPLHTGSACVVHWRPLRHPIAASDDHVSVRDALVQVIGCLPPRAAIAALDSVLHLRMIHPRELAHISDAIPQRQRWMLARVDSRAESGLESIVRCLAQDLGFAARIQVRIAGAGRVDLVIEDWIVVEVDGDEFHDAATAPNDRRRDAVVAASGRTPLRFRYAQVVFAEREVALAIIGAVRSHRRVRNSGGKSARARVRLQKMLLT